MTETPADYNPPNIRSEKSPHGNEIYFGVATALRVNGLDYIVLADSAHGLTMLPDALRLDPLGRTDLDPKKFRHAALGPKIEDDHVAALLVSNINQATPIEHPASTKTAAVIAAHSAELISEGQAARILGIDRIEFRELKDALRQEGHALLETLKPLPE